MTGAIGLPDPDNPDDPPLETEGVGEDPGTVPAEHEGIPLDVGEDAAPPGRRERNTDHDDG